MTAPLSELARAAELARLTAERDAALAEVQRLREAVTGVAAAWDAWQAVPFAEPGDVTFHDLRDAIRVCRSTGALSAARALVSPP